MTRWRNIGIRLVLSTVLCEPRLSALGIRHQCDMPDAGLDAPRASGPYPDLRSRHQLDSTAPLLSER